MAPRAVVKAVATLAGTALAGAALSACSTGPGAGGAGGVPRSVASSSGLAPAPPQAGEQHLPPTVDPTNLPTGRPISVETTELTFCYGLRDQIEAVERVPSGDQGAVLEALHEFGRGMEAVGTPPAMPAVVRAEWESAVDTLAEVDSIEATDDSPWLPLLGERLQEYARATCGDILP